MRREGSISSVAGKVIIKNLLEKGGNPADIAKNKAVLQVSDRDSLLAVVDQIISDNVAVVAEIKAGKEKAMKFLLGEAMKRTKGSGNPTELEKFFRERIGLT